MSQMPGFTLDAVELLAGIRGLGIYSEPEWAAYAAHFRRGHLATKDLRLVKSAGELLQRRVRERRGADEGWLPGMPSLEDAVTRRQGRTLGIVSGCYDLLHDAHARSIAYARSELERHPAPMLIALTLYDHHIRQKKGADRPVLGLPERVELLFDLRAVDLVVPLEEPNCLQAIRALRPELFFKDRADHAQGIVLEEMDAVRSYGGKVAYFPKPDGRARSTTMIIDELRRR